MAVLRDRVVVVVVLWMANDKPLVSIVIPVLNEAENITGLLKSLSGEALELIVVDGGSTDNTVALAEPLADVVLRHTPGRASQMNAGSSVANGDYLWFVHADSTLLYPISDYQHAICSAKAWGFFKLRLSSPAWYYRCIETLINLRVGVSHVATGDTGLFVRRELFESLGGYANIPLMEDVELTKRLRALAKPFRSNLCLQSSSRRWEKRGVVSTVLLMWRLRLLYVLGASPQKLAREYR